MVRKYIIDKTVAILLKATQGRIEPALQLIEYYVKYPRHDHLRPFQFNGGPVCSNDWMDAADDIKGWSDGCREKLKSLQIDPAAPAPDDEPNIYFPNIYYQAELLVDALLKHRTKLVTSKSFEFFEEACELYDIFILIPQFNILVYAQTNFTYLLSMSHKHNMSDRQHFRLWQLITSSDFSPLQAEDIPVPNLYQRLFNASSWDDRKNEADIILATVISKNLKDCFYSSDIQRFLNIKNEYPDAVASLQLAYINFFTFLCNIADDLISGQDIPYSPETIKIFLEILNTLDPQLKPEIEERYLINFKIFIKNEKLKKFHAWLSGKCVGEYDFKDLKKAFSDAGLEFEYSDQVEKKLMTQAYREIQTSRETSPTHAYLLREKTFLRNLLHIHRFNGKDNLIYNCAFHLVSFIEESDPNHAEEQYIKELITFFCPSMKNNKYLPETVTALGKIQSKQALNYILENPDILKNRGHIELLRLLPDESIEQLPSYYDKNKISDLFLNFLKDYFSPFFQSKFYKSLTDFIMMPIHTEHQRLVQEKNEIFLSSAREQTEKYITEVHNKIEMLNNLYADIHNIVIAELNENPESAIQISDDVRVNICKNASLHIVQLKTNVSCNTPTDKTFLLLETLLNALCIIPSSHPSNSSTSTSTPKSPSPKNSIMFGS